jgi:P27 family predicted phage terminase small subunit
MAMAATASKGRKAAPRNLKLLAGTGPGRDSGGRLVPPDIPFNRGALQKPRDMSPDASALWDHIVEQMSTVGILKPLDQASLEIACEVFAVWRQAVRQRRQYGLLTKNSQGVVTASWVRIEREYGQEFRSWCAEYGLTPAAENKLSMERNASNVGQEAISSNPFA